MLDADLPGTNPDPEERLSRRDFLFGFAVASAVALPVLSAPARAAVSMLHTGLDPELVKPESEIVRVGRGGGRGGGGRGGGGRGGGGRHYGGGGRHYGGGGSVTMAMAVASVTMAIATMAIATTATAIVTMAIAVIEAGAGMADAGGAMA